MGNQKISVVIITKNEEKMIEDCLRSVMWADEIVVVDDYSSDRTLEIARGYTPKVIQRRLDTLGLQKRFAVDQASYSWVLSLDADERVSLKLAEEIKKLFRSEPPYGAYNISFANHFLGHAVNYGGENYFHPRLFNKKFAEMTPNAIHEGLLTKGEVGSLSGKIIHYSYKNLPQIIIKFWRYSKPEAEKLLEEKTEFCWLYLLKYPLLDFYVRVFSKEGYKDGVWGIMLASMFSFYEFARFLRYGFILRRQNLRKQRHAELVSAFRQDSDPSADGSG